MVAIIVDSLCTFNCCSYVHVYMYMQYLQNVHILCEIFDALASCERSVGEDNGQKIEIIILNA